MSRTIIVSPAQMLLVTLYGGLVCMAGILGTKILAVGPLAVEGGILAFLFLVGLSSAAAELYGRRFASRLVLIGFVPLVVAALLIRLVIALPPAPFWAAQQPAFAALLGQSARMMIAGMIAYGVSQLLNVAIFSRLKRREGRRLLWLRAAVAGMVSQVADTMIFIAVAFYGVQPLLPLLVGQVIAKVTLSAVLVPPFIYAVVALARRIDGTEPGDGAAR
ncbi:queuosine precursor transporter [Sphingomonas solaris]|uniref:Probable queuosine precursor transporter n=1 Tax=Alterirhizorhabdus solaris TaxID=2529389 RepID=A0A558R7U0_9SPHN|nr:queuosine precursor transporter [Sphingomonas solaris]TVV75372.1 queuosine precursor transporter [Sphingomonas solaris]